MLKQLAIQIGASKDKFTGPPELIILYDEDAVNRQLIEGITKGEFGGQPEVAIRLSPTRNATLAAQRRTLMA